MFCSAKEVNVIWHNNVPTYRPAMALVSRQPFFHEDSG
jgi:hypothetical protein